MSEENLDKKLLEEEAKEDLREVNQWRELVDFRLAVMRGEVDAGITRGEVERQLIWEMQYSFILND